MQTFTILAVLLAIAVALAVAARRLGLPYAVALVLAGMALALLPGLPAHLGEVRLDPRLAMAVFLPPLLQASAFVTPLRDFRRSLRPILLLAVGLVGFTTISVGIATRMIFPDMPWALCFAFGALISPPDAAAAAAVLSAARLPRRVITVLEGESLLNDASGLVLFNLAVAAIATGTFSAWGAAATFVWLAAGGLAAGWASGRLASLIASRLAEPMLEISVSFLAAFGSFAAAEAIGASGLLAAVASGLTMAWHAPEWSTPRTRIAAAAVWEFAAFLLNTVVFTLIGLELRGIFDRFGGLPPAWFLGDALLLSAVLIASRFVWTFPVAYGHRALFPAIRRVDPYPPWRHVLLMCWAGMRGVVSMAAALSIPAGVPGRDAVLALTFIAILVTLVVQGTTLAPLARLLGVAAGPAPPGPTDAAVRRRLAEAAVRHLTSRHHDEMIGPFARDLTPGYAARAEAERLREANPAAAEAERLALAGLGLEALAIQRTLLFGMYRAQEVDDQTMRALLEELDLEELRVRRTGEGAGRHEQ
ncbi:MAG: Na+/H+ antiporter [Acetobacteraceae bacterium]|nr:Na+/H+ antiporter [Acetobacteraceae bacterium]